MGDLTENNLINGAGSVFEQVQDPHSQLSYAIKTLSPIKDKILFGVESNHSRRTKNVAGLSIDRLICEGLGVPYAGDIAYCYFVARNPVRKQSFSYKCVFAHGSGGGTTIAGKYKLGEKYLFIVADAYFYGHVHVTGRVPGVYYDWSKGGNASIEMQEKPYYIYPTGSFLDWQNSYAESKPYKPAAKECIAVDFYSPIHGSSKKKQSFNVFTPYD